VPISEKQLAANRANAANAVKGAGPQRRFHSSTITPEGNARSHGHEIAHLKTDLTAVCQPVNSQERFAVERMAHTQQAMFRELAGDGDIEITRAQNRNYALAEGFHRMARQPAQAERHYRRAVEEFDRLKPLRAELPNEAILEVQPKENETFCAPPHEPVSTPKPKPEPSVNAAAPEVTAAGSRGPNSAPPGAPC
jgi:hypothetical protein